MIIGDTSKQPFIKQPVKIKYMSILKYMREEII